MAPLTAQIDNHTTASTPRPHVLYSVQVTRPDGQSFSLQKRYSDVREQLLPHICCLTRIDYPSSSLNYMRASRTRDRCHPSGSSPLPSSHLHGSTTRSSRSVKRALTGTSRPSSRRPNMLPILRFSPSCLPHTCPSPV